MIGTRHRADATQGFPAINAWHRQIQKHHIRLQPSGQQVQAIVSAGSSTHFKPQWLQHIDQQLAVSLFVVHHQNLSARTGVAFARFGSQRTIDARAMNRRRRQVQLGQEQSHLKHRALPYFAFRFQLATHQVGQHLGNRQT